MEKFNALLDAFLAALMDVVNDEDTYNVLVSARTRLGLAVFMSPSMVYDSLGPYVAKYAQHVQERNDRFFLGMDIYPFEHVKNAYVSLSEENKNVVWQYIDAICDCYHRDE